MSSEFVAVASADAVSDGSGACVTANGREIALFRVGDDYFAIDNECPHQGGPLCDGSLNGHAVTCPWHGWEFDITTGECLTVAGFDVATYSVQIVDGIVHIQSRA